MEKPPIRCKLIVLTLVAAMLPTSTVAQSLPKPPPIRLAPKQQDGALTPRQLEIIRIVRAGDGYITEDLHREFWANVAFDPTTPEAREVLKVMSDAVIGPAQKLGYETWLSARLSLRAGRVVKSEGLQGAIDGTLNAHDNPEFRAGAAKSVSSVEPLLRAAANGTPMKTAHGPMFITEDIIDATLAGIQGGTKRAEILFNPIWETPLEYYRYPNAKVAVLSPWPFTPTKSDLTAPNGISAVQHTLSRIVSGGQSVNIGFSDFSEAVNSGNAAWPDPSGTARRNVVAMLRGTGAKPVGVAHSEQWRGYPSGVGSGSIADASESGWISVRNVYIPEHKGFLVFATFSMVSLADSQSLLAELEANTQVLR